MALYRTNIKCNYEHTIKCLLAASRPELCFVAKRNYPISYVSQSYFHNVVFAFDVRQFNCANRLSIRKSTAHFGAYPTTTGGSVQLLLSAPIELDKLTIVSLLIASNSAHKFALIAEPNDTNRKQSLAFKSSNNSRKLSCSSAFGRMEKIANRNIS